MNQKDKAEAFEKSLLEHTEMCYSVALALTRDPDDARELTHDVLTWAWQFRDNVDWETGFKMKLLTALRERFLLQHLNPAFNVRNNAAFAEV